MKQSVFMPLLLALVFALCLLMLTGCTQATPAQPETTAETAAPTVREEAALPTGSFASADGSLEYTWELGEVQVPDTLPVVEVTPHFLTGEDMKHICRGLLGDVPFYDLGPLSQRQLSRDQLQKKIDIMNLYQDQETLMNLWKSDDNAAYLSEHNRALEYLKETLKTAPEQNNLKPCDWQIKNEKDYDDYLNSEGYQTLRATANVNGIDYYCDLFLNEQATEHRDVSNWMKLSLGTDDTYSTVEHHIRSQLCTSPEPTQAQYDAVVQKAQAMLDAMGMGEYKAVNPRYDPNYFGDEERFEIYVDVVPVFEGVPALAGHWGQNYLGSQPYSTTYGITRGIFSFSPKGDLINFNLGSLVEQDGVLDPAAAVLPLEELANKAQAILTAYDVNAISASGGNWILWQHGTENLTCKVRITGVDFGLARYSPYGNEQRFVYQPAAAFRGTVAYYDRQTGELITTSDDTSVGIGQAPLVVLNALDGTVI
ncbi:MAG: DUF6034 family protein [Eubacteriales bacterium]|nr:DUF6034 family protein [Eubacteriales bacterium]